MKTKIVCTLGPASESLEKIKEMITAGMTVARINCSHGPVEWRRKIIRTVKKAREELKAKHVKIMLDMRGPEIRIGRFGDVYEKTGDNGFIILKDGQEFTFHTKAYVGDQKGVFVTYEKLPSVVKKGQEILLNDGLIICTVESVGKDTVTVRAKVGGELKDRKTLFVPGCDLGLPFISAEDAEDLVMACEEDVDWCSPSFTSSSKDLIEFKAFLKKHGRDYSLISKIESVTGYENLDDILSVTEGIMVARGDLGVEYPYHLLPAIQKDIIVRTLKAKRILVTATEMHESMIKNARPTRAETTDVANAVWDGTEYIMTSAETAVGKYPVETIKSMLKIAAEAEKHKKYYRV